MWAWPVCVKCGVCVWRRRCGVWKCGCEGVCLGCMGWCEGCPLYFSVCRRGIRWWGREIVRYWASTLGLLACPGSPGAPYPGPCAPLQTMLGASVLESWDIRLQVPGISRPAARRGVPARGCSAWQQAPACCLLADASSDSGGRAPGTCALRALSARFWGVWYIL